MKLNLLTLMITAIILTSCQMSGNQNHATADTLANVGGNKDSHGCLTSAGYIWSQLRGECIRPFEEGIALNIMNTSQSYQSAAYVLVDSIKNQAEIFVPEEVQSIVLDKTDNELYSNGKFNLNKEEFCWTLSLNQIKLYQERK